MAVMDAVAEWYAANDSGDIERILGTLTPGGTFRDPVTNGAVFGDGLRQVLEQLFGMLRNCSYTVLAAGAWSEVEAAARWSMTAEHVDTGRQVVVEGADFFTYDQSSERFTSVVGIFDQQDLRRQLR